MLRFEGDALVGFAAQVLRAGGMADDQVGIVAELLIAGDRLGHDTHGITLLPRYFEALQSGGMLGQGAPEVLHDHEAAIVWDGKYLCGIWLVQQALELASTRARKFGLAAVAIRRSHHTAC